MILRGWKSVISIRSLQNSILCSLYTLPCELWVPAVHYTARHLSSIFVTPDRLSNVWNGHGARYSHSKETICVPFSMASIAFWLRLHFPFSSITVMTWVTVENKSYWGMCQLRTHSLAYREEMTQLTTPRRMPQLLNSYASGHAQTTAFTGSVPIT